MQEKLGGELATDVVRRYSMASAFFFYQKELFPRFVFMCSQVKGDNFGAEKGR